MSIEWPSFCFNYSFKFLYLHNKWFYFKCFYKTELKKSQIDQKYNVHIYKLSWIPSYASKLVVLLWLKTNNKSVPFFLRYKLKYMCYFWNNYDNENVTSLKDVSLYKWNEDKWRWCIKKWWLILRADIVLFRALILDHLDCFLKYKQMIKLLLMFEILRPPWKFAEAFWLGTTPSLNMIFDLIKTNLGAWMVWLMVTT